MKDEGGFNVSPTELMIIQSEYMRVLNTWVDKENKITKADEAQRKMYVELLILNPKLLVMDSAIGAEMREFLFQVRTSESADKLLISRLFDLMIYVDGAFPTKFLRWKEAQYTHDVATMMCVSEKSLLSEYASVAVIISNLQMAKMYFG